MRQYLGFRVARGAQRRAFLPSSLALVLALALSIPLAAGARPIRHSSTALQLRSHVPNGLIGAAYAHPDRSFAVIVQGDGVRAGTLAKAVDGAAPGEDRAVSRRFGALRAVAANLTGRELIAVAKKPGVLAISPDSPVRLAGGLSQYQWPSSVAADAYWPSSTGTLGSTTVPASSVPTIAIIDSGIDPSRPDVAGRVLTQVNMVGTGGANAPGDGRGHGTFVASIAAGSASGYYGVAPTAKLVSIDVADDTGVARTSDVIAAADWVLQNRAAYNIKVANFSLHSTAASTFMYDPLNKAVERLWFAGVTVVAAAGNYAQNGQVSGIPYPPANDPFVITVGAADINGSTGVSDDVNAPWSAYGYTLDGFAKPEVGAPGRYMVGAVPPGATLPQERPANVVAPGYMQLSGTSFAAPVVAGMAADLQALHPNWGPDQIKGALMATVKKTSAAPASIGLGEVKVTSASNIVGDPPNPNAGLERFLVSDPAGGTVPVFDSEAWKTTVQANPDTWDAASWTSASWTSASWTSASWTSASWTSASWTSASWTSQAAASWTSASASDASWTSTSQSDASWLSNADDDFKPNGGYLLSQNP